MARCGHCQKDTIGFVAKWWSSPAHPAHCGECGSYSYVATRRPSSMLWAAAGLVVPITAVAAEVASAYWPLFIGALVVLALMSWEAVAFSRLPMISTTPSGALEALRWERVGLSILLVLAVGVVVAHGISRAF